MTSKEAVTENQIALLIKKENLNELLERGFPMLDSNGDSIERFEVKRKGRGPFKLTAILKEKR
ncbi:MAG TPA: hypothetical protein DCY20_01550 [Firmicutes bacterium]|nr:hypothetical protein [Bacillota bacterium]